MRVVIQRVNSTAVSINNKVKSQINTGLFILLGIEDADTIDDVIWLTGKIIGLRIFPDNEGVMNLSIKDVNGEIIVVSQFTLHASTKKGNRPSYIKAAKPEKAIPLYKEFISSIEGGLEKKIQTGEFGADMQIEIVNDGPVTIIIDSKNRE
jgi:D-tyrosyl-tRNA(Tyr) deacylase